MSDVIEKHRRYYLDDIFMLQGYIQSRYFEPKSTWSNKMIIERGFEVWACNDILKNCKENPDCDPREVVLGFIERMELHISDRSIDENLKRYSIAKNVAQDLLIFLN